MYFDLTFCHAKKAESFTCLDLRKEASKPKDFTVFNSLMTSLKYTLIDALCISLITWMAGGSFIL